MAASVRNVVWSFQQVQLGRSYLTCLRQWPRLASSKVSGTVKSTTKGNTKKATKQATSEPVPVKPKAPSNEATPYTYEVPQYDDWFFYNVESDMSKHRLPQPQPGKP
ncbi:uncharacterized protein LOC110983127 [Acanthaster planci]|uniref:Uncharacterized protein LOC110983127 n=1 Tax=Acanthaster planci TaxID=133434 RepID=A0A8B7YWU1_ACAPL|nr:uncharacterized protein LOC110983127 [Acanthaster planci]